MRNCRYKKYKDVRDKFRSACLNQWVIQMPNKPEMDRQIPSFPILLNTPTIPPVSIKVSISKKCEFPNDIKP